MKKIIQTWLKGCVVILRFGGFFAVLYMLGQLVGSIVFMFTPLVLLLSKEQLEKYKGLIFGGGFILAIVIFAPFVFYFVSKWTGLLDNESRLERFLSKLREKKQDFNKDVSVNSDSAAAESE
jgi:hypothetical protein